jgi:protein-disulfide isomerase
MRGDFMSKRQEMREKRRRERLRNQIVIVLLVVAGALLITFALIVPGLQSIQNASATATVGASSSVVVITPQAINAQVDGTHLGDPNAPVKVEIYEDFRCSACKYYTQTIEPTIIKDYVETGIVYYSFHNYIVIDGYDGTKASYNSALASECAADQGRFWEYHETLYANQVTEDAALFSDERLATMAQNLNLDMTAFNQCFQDQTPASIVDGDIADAQSLGITGTPSIFVNGALIKTSLNDLITAIEAAKNGQ